MLTVNSIDLSGYNRMVSGLRHALIGTGQDGDMSLFVRTEARQWAWEIARELSPGTKAKGAKKIERDAKKVFRPMENSKTGEPWNIFFGRQAAGQSGMRWLYAGPEFLVGIRSEDYQPGLNAGALEQIYNEQGRGKAARGNAWEDLGEKVTGYISRRKKYLASRGKQHVIRLNRIAVLKSSFYGLTKKLEKRLGRLSATFAFAATKLGFTGVPGWISKHFSEVGTDGAAIFDMSKLSDPLRPEITFGSRAPGVQSNPHIVQKIQHSTAKRAQVAAAKLKKVMRGYTYDFNTGGVFKSQKHEITRNE